MQMVQGLGQEALMTGMLQRMMDLVRTMTGSDHTSPSHCIKDHTMTSRVTQQERGGCLTPVTQQTHLCALHGQRMRHVPGERSVT
jgi:hypothetical protein